MLALFHGRCSYQPGVIFLEKDTSMMRHPLFSAEQSTRMLGKLLLALFLSLMASLTSTGLVDAAEPAAEGQAAAPAATESVQTLNLSECLALAGQRQPRLAAQRASLAAAEDGKRALDALALAALIDHEIPVRRRQAALGVNAAAAALDQTEREVAYAVTRSYFTVLYAREQERVAQGVVDRLTAIQKSAQDAVKIGAADTTTADVNRTLVYVRLAEGRRVQAAQGGEACPGRSEGSAWIGA